MSTTASVTLACDHEGGCGQTYVAAGSKPAAARTEAADLGWTRKGQSDYCPLHEADAREDDRA